MSKLVARNSDKASTTLLAAVRQDMRELLMHVSCMNAVVLRDWGLWLVGGSTGPSALWSVDRVVAVVGNWVPVTGNMVSGKPRASCGPVVVWTLGGVGCVGVDACCASNEAAGRSRRIVLWCSVSTVLSTYHKLGLLRVMDHMR